MPLYIAKQSTDDRGGNNRSVIVDFETGETVQMNLQNSYEKSAAGAKEVLIRLENIRSKLKVVLFAAEEVKTGQETSFQVLSEEELNKLAEGKIAKMTKK
jgi:hypothetical protein